MASLCRRSLQVTKYDQAADLSLDLAIVQGVVAFTIRVVDATGVPVAFTVATKAEPTQRFHFSAGEAWSEERLDLDADLELVVTSAAATHDVELLTWSS